MKALNMDPKEDIPFNFLFRGPPGTGKTTTAKKMGKVFYDMGLLASAEVVECSATDIIGQYVGQTGPKAQQQLDKALGRVLFVDEAYRLAEGNFAKEAMDEIVDAVTKDRYFKKLVIILAGYETDINRLMSVNAGLTSRFPEVIDFRPLTAEECVALMLLLLRKQKDSLRVKSKKDLDLSCLEEPTTGFKQGLLQIFTELAAQDNWASARDVQALAKGMFNKVLRDKDGRGHLVLTEDTVTTALAAMLRERASRATAYPAPPPGLHEILQAQSASLPPLRSPHLQPPLPQPEPRPSLSRTNQALPLETTTTSPTPQPTPSKQPSAPNHTQHPTTTPSGPPNATQAYQTKSGPSSSSTSKPKTSARQSTSVSKKPLRKRLTSLERRSSQTCSRKRHAGAKRRR
jgi:DNA polymerase III delta prime subunit